MIDASSLLYRNLIDKTCVVGYLVTIAQWYVNDPENLGSGETFVELLAHPADRTIIVAINPDTDLPVGFCSIYTNPDWPSRDPSILNMLYVAPEFRRNSIGDALLEHTIRQWRATRHPGAQVELYVDPDNDKAINLYEQFGFSKVRYIRHAMHLNDTCWQMVYTPRKSDEESA